MTDDERIIARVLKGHSEEYRELVQRHQGSVFRLACRVLGRREDAEDVVQETFVRAFRHLSSCRERDRFWLWIRRIAMNVCLKRIPREVPFDTIDDLVDCSPDQGSPIEAEVLRRLESAEVKQAIDGLPAIYRTAVVLRYEENLTYKEIAEMIGESADVVRIRLHRAKKMLAQRLAVMKHEMC